MSRFFDRHSRSAAWISGLVAASGMILTSFWDATSWGPRLGQSLFVGAVVGGATFLATRSRENSE
jgi:hypothetical protein